MQVREAEVSVVTATVLINGYIYAVHDLYYARKEKRKMSFDSGINEILFLL